MKFFKLGFAFVSIGFLASCAAAASKMYSYSANEVPVGKVLIYEKSNLDGTNLGLIAVYTQSNTVIESFKWHTGHTQATKVRAELNPDTLNVKRFDGLQINADGSETTRAELTALADGTFKVNLGGNEQTVSLPETAWHSYDFDFASLGYAFKFINNKKEPIEFNIFDIDLLQNEPQFVDFGSVQLLYQQTEAYAGVPSLKYAIDGPGLDHRGGFIWFSEDNGDLVGFEIEKPDEPGFESGKLVLVDTKTLSEQEWADFQTKALNS